MLFSIEKKKKTNVSVFLFRQYILIVRTLFITSSILLCTHARSKYFSNNKKKHAHVSYSCLANRRYVLLAEGLTRAAAQVACVLCAVCFYHLSFYCILHSHSTPRTTCNQTISCRRPTDAWLLLYHHREQSKCSV